MSKKLVLTLSALLLAAAPAMSSPADDAMAAKPVLTIIDHYLNIQTALAGDTIAPIAVEAAAIGAFAAQVTDRTSAEALRVGNADAAAGRALMPAIAAAAGKLGKAKDLKGARAAFGELSRPMVGYRTLVTGEKPNVAYCPMAKKNWLQDGKIIANPYYGSSMLRCGTIVNK